MTRGNQDPDSPKYVGRAHAKQAKAVGIVRDVYKGTIHLRSKGQKHLPKFPNEQDGAYKDRRDQSVLFNAFKRTVKGLTGMVFRKDPTFSDEVPTDIVESHAPDIDLTGRSLEVFARDLFEDGIIDGHVHILVDFQPENTARNRAEEEELGLRPYWVAIKKQDVLSYRTRRINGKTTLIQFVYRESATVSDGRYGEKQVTRYRAYWLTRDEEEGRIVGFRVFEEQEDDDASGKEDDLRVVDEGFMAIDEIPLVTAYADREGFMMSNPPLLDLALENIRHWQLRSDRDMALHVTNNPVPIFIGLDEDDEVTIGAGWGIKLPIQGDAKYMEPQGRGLQEARQELQDTQKRMAALGLAMLERRTRQAETAKAKIIDKSESDAALAVAARGLEDALDEALRLHAKWMNRDEGGHINVNRDFTEEMLSPQMVTVLSNLVANGHLTLDTMWDALIAGEALPDGFDPEVERAMLEGGNMLPGEGAALDEGEEGPTEELPDDSP